MIHDIPRLVNIYQRVELLVDEISSNDICYTDNRLVILPGKYFDSYRSSSEPCRILMSRQFFEDIRLSVAGSRVNKGASNLKAKCKARELKTKVTFLSFNELSDMNNFKTINYKLNTDQRIFQVIAGFVSTTALGEKYSNYLKENPINSDGFDNIVLIDSEFRLILESTDVLSDLKTNEKERKYPLTQELLFQSDNIVLL